MAKPVKVESVKEIETKLKNAQMTVLVVNKGLSVPAVTELRKKLRDSGIEYKVFKNTLFLRAASALKYTGLEQVMTGPMAVAFSPEPIEPSKVLTKFAKENPKLEIKGALYGNAFVSAEEVKKYSAYLGRQEVLTQIVCMLNQPLSSFVRVVDALRAQKEAAK